MKTVILSTNDNPDYLSYLTYVQKAWNNIGWKTLTFYLGKKNIQSDNYNTIISIENNSNYSDILVVQTSRFFGHRYTDGLIMISDIDMMPLSDYWHPSENAITCYGHDLTGYGHIPMCYVAAPKSQWDIIIPENSIDELLQKYPYLSEANDWYTDQEIITARISTITSKVMIDRGQRRGVAIGRIDRCDWLATKNTSDTKIDAHLLKPFNKEETLDLLYAYHNIK